MDIEELRNRIDKNIPKIKLKEFGPSYLWGKILLGTMVPGPRILVDKMEILYNEGTAFTGKPGNGRHTAANALAASKCNPKLKSNCPHYLRITGWDFYCEKVEEALKIVDMIMELAKEYKKLCLMFDSPEKSRFNMHIQYYLAKKLNKPNPSVYIIIISEKEEYLCRELIENFKICQCASPSREQRSAWLNDNMSEPPVLIEGINNMELLDRTEGYTWKQLNDMIAFMHNIMTWRLYNLYMENGKNETLLNEAIDTAAITITKDEAVQIFNSLSMQVHAPVMAAQVQVQTSLGKTASKNTETEDFADSEKIEEKLIKDAEKHKDIKNLPVDDLLDDL